MNFLYEYQNNLPKINKLILNLTEIQNNIEYIINVLSEFQGDREKLGHSIAKVVYLETKALFENVLSDFKN